MSNPITPLTPAQTATAEFKALHHGYIVRNLIAVDTALNVASDGYEDETISSRAARYATMTPTTKLQQVQHDYGVLMSHFLDVFQTDHGSKAEAGDYADAEQIAAVEKDSGDIAT